MGGGDGGSCLAERIEFTADEGSAGVEGESNLVITFRLRSALLVSGPRRDAALRVSGGRGCHRHRGRRGKPRVYRRSANRKPSSQSRGRAAYLTVGNAEP